MSLASNGMAVPALRGASTWARHCTAGGTLHCMAAAPSPLRKRTTLTSAWRVPFGPPAPLSPGLMTTLAGAMGGVGGKTPPTTAASACAQSALPRAQSRMRCAQSRH